MRQVRTLTLNFVSVVLSFVAVSCGQSKVAELYPDNLYSNVYASSEPYISANLEKATDVSAGAKATYLLSEDGYRYTLNILDDWSNPRSIKNINAIEIVTNDENLRNRWLSDLEDKKYTHFNGTLVPSGYDRYTSEDEGTYYFVSVRNKKGEYTLRMLPIDYYEFSRLRGKHKGSLKADSVFNEVQKKYSHASINRPASTVIYFDYDGENLPEYFMTYNGNHEETKEVQVSLGEYHYIPVDIATKNGIVTLIGRKSNAPADEQYLVKQYAPSEIYRDIYSYDWRPMLEKVNYASNAWFDDQREKITIEYYYSPVPRGVKEIFTETFPLDKIGKVSDKK